LSESLPARHGNVLAGLNPASIELPRQAPAPQPASRREPPEQPPAPPRTANLPPAGSGASEQRRGPVLALAGVAVAVALAVAGGAYWWLSGDSPAPVPKTASPVGTPPAVVAPPVEQALAADVDGGQRPLLMPGKKTLFQRVLSKPGASFSSEPGATPDKPVPAFSVLYVYQRKNLDGRSWLRLGAASDGRSAGWLPAEQVSDWKQSLVLK
ncbi:serine/threonine protein kinase, partial [Pseudomonas sp. MWU13-2625]